MEVTQDIKLNINDTGQYLVVSVKQADSGRKLRVTMMDDDTEITVPNTATVSVRVLKADGTSVDDSCTVSGGKIIVALTSQITAVEGYAKADVSVASGGKIVSTATFLLKVGAVPVGVQVVSQNEFTQLSALIASASQYESRIGDLEALPKIYYGTVSDIDAGTGEMEVEDVSIDDLEVGTTLYIMFGLDWVDTSTQQYLDIDGVGTIAISDATGNTWIPTSSYFSVGDNVQFVYDGDNWILVNAPIEAKINTKADSSSVYTQTQTDALLDTKANKSTVYSKLEVTALLAHKADSSSVYTKTETDDLLDDKADAYSTITDAEIEALFEA
mgnify:FL=1